MAETKDLSGVLFKNKRKTTDRHPDYTGTALINGQEYWLSSWINTPKNGGDKYMSLMLNLKDENGPKTPPKPYNQADFDDDVPF